MKKRIKKWPFVLGIIVIAAVLAFIFLPSLMKGGTETAAGTANMSAVVTTGSITTSVVATGNLTNAAIEVPFPYDVTVDTLLVAKGDTVRQGDTLATVDSSSVSTAISAAKDELSDVNDNLEAISDKDTESAYVYAKATGRVKAVYAKEGETTSKVITSSGALMILSMDGKMAVDIPTASGIKVGDDVNVILSDGGEEDGKIAAVTGGGITVTLTDYGPKLNESVSVTKGAKKLGGGKLYIHSPMRILNTGGTVERVYVSENRKVYSGTSLLRLSVPVADTTYASLKEKQAWLQDLLEKLNNVYVSGAVAASTGGTVGEIFVSEGGILTSDGTMEPNADGTPNDQGVGFAITRSDKLSLIVSIDELDIAAVKAGDEVSLALDALEGKTFPGIVSEVADEATISGNVAGYEATIELDRDPDMKTGMSATATIINQKKDNVLLIPMAAVQQYADNVFVYTSMDQDGVLGGETTIETGLSDGNNVEVLSGLSAGQTVYYVQATTSDQSAARQRNMLMGGQGQMVTGGSRPGGGTGGGGTGGAPRGNG